MTFAEQTAACFSGTRAELGCGLRWPPLRSRGASAHGAGGLLLLGTAGTPTAVPTGARHRPQPQDGVCHGLRDRGQACSLSRRHLDTPTPPGQKLLPGTLSAACDTGWPGAHRGQELHVGGPRPPGDAPCTVGHCPRCGHSPNVILPLSSWSTARKRRSTGSSATPNAVLRMVDRASVSTLPSSGDPYICEAEAGVTRVPAPMQGGPGLLRSPAGRLRCSAPSPRGVPSPLSSHPPPPPPAWTRLLGRCLSTWAGTAPVRWA